MFGIPEWISSSDEVNALARVLLDAGEFDSQSADPRAIAENVLEFMEKPHHWDAEYRWWVANNRTYNLELWEDGRDKDWEVT